MKELFLKETYRQLLKAALIRPARDVDDVTRDSVFSLIEEIIKLGVQLHREDDANGFYIPSEHYSPFNTLNDFITTSSQTRRFDAWDLGFLPDDDG